MSEDLIDTAKVAEMVGVARGTVERWRWAGRGPKWYKLGPRLIKYRESEVRQWIKDNLEKKGD